MTIKGISGVDEGSRVKEPKLKINVIYVYINIHINYIYYSDYENNNKTRDNLKLYFEYTMNEE